MSAMTKAELQAEFEQLRSKVEQLEARLIIAEQQKTVVLPAPSYPAYPHWQYPWWPQVWCSTDTNISKLTVNGEDTL